MSCTSLTFTVFIKWLQILMFERLLLNILIPLFDERKLFPSQEERIADLKPSIPKPSSMLDIRNPAIPSKRHDHLFILEFKSFGNELINRLSLVHRLLLTNITEHNPINLMHKDMFKTPCEQGHVLAAMDCCQA
jgi:hypothetical protein